ncbi:MAG: hypothetical protein A2Y40_01825 [Candidatus Margulisbacteria bacterium GWF2_35_9]|nr:MAG: hypothetical protein A2Y40_01825 [Candidatus Margulisbacteria bacterium GWF2_35_9]
MKIGLSYFYNIMLIVFLMLILAYGSVYLMNMLSGKKMKNKRLKIKEFLPLQPQVGLYIISVDNEELLVAISNKSIQSIQKIDALSFDKELTKVQKSRQNVSSNSN